jgi:hypothetical protein
MEAGAETIIIAEAAAARMEEIFYHGTDMATRIIQWPDGPMPGTVSGRDFPQTRLQAEDKADILFLRATRMQQQLLPIIRHGEVTGEGPGEGLAEDRLIILPENYFWAAAAAQAIRMITTEAQGGTEALWFT